MNRSPLVMQSPVSFVLDITQIARPAKVLIYFNRFEIPLMSSLPNLLVFKLTVIIVNVVPSKCSKPAALGSQWVLQVRHFLASCRVLFLVSSCVSTAACDTSMPRSCQVGVEFYFC